MGYKSSKLLQKIIILISWIKVQSRYKASSYLHKNGVLCQAKPVSKRQQDVYTGDTVPYLKVLLGVSRDCYPSYGLKKGKQSLEGAALEDKKDRCLCFKVCACQPQCFSGVTKPPFATYPAAGHQNVYIFLWLHIC